MKGTTSSGSYVGWTLSERERPLPARMLVGRCRRGNDLFRLACWLDVVGEGNDLFRLACGQPPSPKGEGMRMRFVQPKSLPLQGKVARVAGRKRSSPFRPPFVSLSSPPRRSGHPLARRRFSKSLPLQGKVARAAGRKRSSPFLAAAIVPFPAAAVVPFPPVFSFPHSATQRSLSCRHL